MRCAPAPFGAILAADIAPMRARAAGVSARAKAAAIGHVHDEPSNSTRDTTMLSLFLKIAVLGAAFVLAVAGAWKSRADADPAVQRSASRFFRLSVGLLFLGVLLGVGDVLVSAKLEQKREREQRAGEQSRRTKEDQLAAERRQAEEKILSNLRIQLANATDLLSRLEQSEEDAKIRSEQELHEARRAATDFDSVSVSSVFAKFTHGEPAVADYMAYMATRPDPAFTRSSATRLPPALRPFVTSNGARVPLPAPDHLEVGIYKKSGARCDRQSLARQETLRMGFGDLWLMSTRGVEGTWLYVPELPVGSTLRPAELIVHWDNPRMGMAWGSQQITSLEDLRSACAYARMGYGIYVSATGAPVDPDDAEVAKALSTLAVSQISLVIRGRHVDLDEWVLADPASRTYVAAFPPID